MRSVMRLMGLMLLVPAVGWAKAECVSRHVRALLTVAESPDLLAQQRQRAASELDSNETPLGFQAGSVPRPTESGSIALESLEESCVGEQAVRAPHAMVSLRWCVGDRLVEVRGSGPIGAWSLDLVAVGERVNCDIAEVARDVALTPQRR